VPSALLARVLPAPTNNGTSDHTTEPWLADVLAGVDEGGRNDAAARLAGYYFSKGFPADVVEHHLLLWNTTCNPPLSPGRIRLTVESIQRTRERQRRDDPIPTAVELQDTKQDVFQLMSLQQYMSTFGDLAVDWLVDGWLPQQTIAMIVSPPGTFKTWILLDLAVSIATGTPFLGIAPVLNPGPVLLVQQEDYHGEIAERIAVIMAARFPMSVTSNGRKGVWDVTLPPNPPIYIHPNRELRFGNEEVMDALEGRIAELRPRAVLIDPLYTTVSMKAGDFMAGAVDDLMRLKLLRDRYACTFGLAHHTTKRAEDSHREDLWGSQMLNAFLETGWQIRPKTADSAIIRRHFKVAKNIEESVLSFDIQTHPQPTHYRPSLVARDEDSETASTKVQRVLEEKGPLTQTQLAKAVGMDKSTVSRATQKLIGERILTVNRDNKYTFTRSFDVQT
jgi:transcription initiation factor IIE alpha subunit